MSSETHLNAFIAVTKKAVLFVVTVLAFIAGALIPRFFFVVSGNGVIDGLVFGLVCAFVAYKGAYIALARRP